MEQPVHLTDAEWDRIQRTRARRARQEGRAPRPQRRADRGLVATAHAMLNGALWMVFFVLAVIAGLYLFVRLAPASSQPAAGAPAAPTAAVSFVAPSGGYAPQSASGGDPAPAADGAVLVAPTPEPPAPTATPAPTADLAQQADVDALANAADLAAGGNPAAATPLPAGYVDLPTVVIGPIDPGGGDVSTLARACANSGAGASCTDPSAAADEAQMACALDMAYATTGASAGGRGCTLPVVRP